MVVLRAQLEVAQHDGDLSARDNQDDEHQGQEAKQVVELQTGREGQEVDIRMALNTNTNGH